MRLLLVPSLAIALGGTVAVAQQPSTATPATAAPDAAVAPAPAAISAPATAAPAATATPAATNTASTGPDANGKYLLHDGDDVNLTFAQDLSSKTSSEGDPIVLILADDLKVGDVIVAKAGAKAFGEVTKAEKSGMMGKAGELNMRLDYLKAGDVKIKLRGTKGKEGESGATGAVVLTVLFGPLGLIHHGKNVEIKQGQTLHAFVGDDVAVPPAS